MKKILPYNKDTFPELWSPDKKLQYQRIIKAFDFYGYSEEEQQWILEALHDSDTWDWYKDCNGANIVSEPCWPKSEKTDIAYAPEYVYHDYAWTKYGPTWTSNYRMWKLQNRRRMDGWRSNLRWLGVTLFGMPVHYITWNVKKLFSSNKDNIKQKEKEK